MQKHSRAGQPTNFKKFLFLGIKLHTIRENYPLWKKRIDEVNTGNAYLSIREWSAKPYASKQEIIQELHAGEVAIQKLKPTDKPNSFWLEDKAFFDEELLAKNDCLDVTDFREWFKKMAWQELAIIHFTPFRY